MIENKSITVAALYKFVAMPDFADYQPGLKEICLEQGVMGTILLASEGINGTIAGPGAGIERVLDHIQGLPGCAELDHKYSYTNEMPFLRMKVRLKKEIVTMGEQGIDPNQSVGTYVRPEDWNALISDPEVLVIDTRNDYEVGIGTFKDAINPETTSFRDFPAWVRGNKNLHNKPKVAMFCTGGIRCEKSTAFLKGEGFDEVYHLKGGILKYLETVPEEKSLWQGECFVFDQRVSVAHGLKPGTYDQCFACRYPITEADKASPQYEPGVSCPRCHDAHSAEQKSRFTERQRQIEASKARGEEHLGAPQIIKAIKTQ